MSEEPLNIILQQLEKEEIKKLVDAGWSFEDAYKKVTGRKYHGPTRTGNEN